MEFVETGILGQGFYPGCRGFSSQRSPIGGVMLLGRDFGTRSSFIIRASPAYQCVTSGALTWRHTLDVYLSLSKPSLNDLPVWCTNYLMGVRIDGSAMKNVRERISTADWPKYETSCWNFLQKQVVLQQPRVIVVFGEPNQLDLLIDKRLGRKWSQTLKTHLSFAMETVIPGIRSISPLISHSLIRNTAKEAARAERWVKRIRELYLSFGIGMAS